MANVYYRKIIASNGEFTVDMVPTRWRSAVQAMLNKDE